MKYLILIVFILVFFGEVRGQEWRLFNSPSNTYTIEFPSIPQNIQGTSIYVSKDVIGNLFAVQEFRPPEDITKDQSSKEILKTTIKALALKQNVFLSETIYSEYKNDWVAVDFTGKISANKISAFKGKAILEGEKIYYMYAVLSDDSTASLKNYSRFIHSFRIMR